jgi:hypothetical protein
MLCPKCGAENAYNTQYCRECGERLPDAVPDQGQPTPDLPAGAPSTALAVTALVLSCAGFVTCGLLSIFGLVLGIVALLRARREPLRFGGEGVAIAAVTVGGVFALFAVTGVVAWMVVLGRITGGDAVGGGMFGVPLGVARAEADKTWDKVNLHNIGIAVMLYSTDSGGRCPGSLADLLGAGYMDDPGLLANPNDPMPRALPDGTPCSYEYIGALPKLPPGPVIMAYTRKGVFADGRNVLRADMAVAWRTEGELTGPKDLLAESYAWVVEWLGDGLTEERDAELRAFYEIGDDRPAPWGPSQPLANATDR